MADQSAGESQLKKPDINRVISKIDEISTLPQVLRRILQVANDPNTGAADLQDILKADPALTARLLKIANSSYYGLREEVTNIKRAVVFLGFKTVKNLAVASSVCDLFKSQETIGSYSREALWKHSVVVAICAKSICNRAGLRIGEDVFTAGIMHDIGITMEDQYLHDDFVRVLQRSDLSEVGLVKAEQEQFGFDHGALGERVAKSWKIPAEIGTIIGCHHKPRFAAEQYRQQCTIIYLADVLCSAKKIGFHINQQVNKTELNTALETLNFRKEDVSLVIEELPREMEKAKELLVI